MQITSTISKGMQITIPSAVRKKLNLKPADQIVFNLDTTPVTLKKAEADAEKVTRIFRELDEMRKRRERHMSPEQKTFAAKTRGWTANQYREYIDDLPETKAYIKEKYGL